MIDTAYTVLADGLVKRYGATTALAGLDLAVPTGTVCGLLGPNGAGKTTAVRVLSTLTRPDGGRATVAGLDVVRDAEAVRHTIGLAGQSAAVDERLTGRDNLRMFGRLYHLRVRASRRRADELLEQFGLADAADRIVKTYSGGMRRRLDIAASLLVGPSVLFLDEPTTGLDPRSRGEVWDAIRALVAGGTTVLLTTQYLEEADQLATSIAVVDHGRVIAADTPDRLKAQTGSDQIDLVVADPADLPAAATVLRRVAGAEPQLHPDPRRVGVPTTAGAAALTAAVRELDAASLTIVDIGLRRPTLDEVFLSLTGQSAESTMDESTMDRTAA